MLDSAVTSAMSGRVQRTGTFVRRPAEFWSPAVHGLLRHLESAGFPAPRTLGIAGGRELLTWIDGESGPAGWAKIVPESGLRRWAATPQLPRRRGELPPAARHPLVQRAGHVRARRDHLPR